MNSVAYAAETYAEKHVLLERIVWFTTKGYIPPVRIVPKVASKKEPGYFGDMWKLRGELASCQILGFIHSCLGSMLG